MAKVIQTRNTPNPDSLKFITDVPLVEKGALSFENATTAKDHPLAEALFAAGPVASVFVMDRFVTVTKFPGAEWSVVEPKIVSAIEATPTPTVAVDAPTSGALPGNDTLALINAVIDENVRPALAGDGGGLDVVDYTDNVLTVHYQGACGSCPSSTSGTLYAIQNLLQRMVDPKIQVVSV